MPGPTLPAGVPSQLFANTYLATTEWHPIVLVEGLLENAPPSMLYSTLKPKIFGTDGRVKASAQVGAGGVNNGPAGNTVAKMVASWQAGIVLTEFAPVVPHEEVNLYRAFILQHPGVFVNSAFA
jgi:hypothetical protein